MEVAVIDWKTLDSRFVQDDLYEHINAPKWVDFAAPEVPVDDEAWFCRPGCNHPKTVEDFLDANQGTPSISKDRKSASASDVSPFGDRNKREATLKKRGGVANNQPLGLSSKVSNYHRIVEDVENQDPNLSTPQNQKARAGKEAIKSSAEKAEFRDDTAMGIGKEQTPKLRSTLSARNLFPGGDFLTKVAEFCNELKKLAVRPPKDKENGDNPEAQADESLGEKEKERKPLLAMSNEKSENEEMNMNTPPASKTKLRKKIRNNNNAENTPVSIDMNKIKPRGEDGVFKIRTCPPTPQCFSAGGNGVAPKDTPQKRLLRPKPPPQERGILQELRQTTKKEATTANNNRVVEKDHGESNTAAVKETKALDVFWFLKPCTTLSS